jgi:hypothetical protein
LVRHKSQNLIDLEPSDPPWRPRGMRRFLIVSMLVSVLSACTSPPAVRESGPKPELTPTVNEFRSEKVGKHRLRVWPRSEDVTNIGTYRFSAPHCGLEWMTDFDGSFWKIVDRQSYGKNGPAFFINSDQGTLTFENDDEVVYVASTGTKVRLHRLSGPIIIQLCA